MMKKMWKMRKDKSAVSPVIATILMVAITVVLAAVLYVMVMGFGGSQSNTATGSLTYTASTNQYKVSLVSINQNNVQNGSVSVSVTTVAGAVAASPVWHCLNGATTTAKIGAGDFCIVPVTSGNTYNVILKDKNSGNSIASASFTVA
jgi:flagellin-like protein